MYLFQGTADRDLVATKAKRMTAAENAAQSTKNRTEILIQSTYSQLISRFSDQFCQLWPHVTIVTMCEHTW